MGTTNTCNKTLAFVYKPPHPNSTVFEFTIIYNNSKTFNGNWNFKAVGNLDNPRPQVGTGELIGEIDENNMVSVDLNPGWADNNAYLNGKFENGVLTGEWSWVGFAGIPEKGTFTASEK